MKLPHQLIVKLSPLVEAARGQPLVEPTMAIAQRSEAYIIVESGHGRFVFDIERRVVMRDDQEMAHFESIQSVDVGSFPGGRGDASWSVSLYLGLFRRITVGRTYDDGDASVIAAKLARAVGCKVVAMRLRR